MDLTRRELNILEQLANGQTNQEIAQQLTLSVRTVENHLHRVYSKMSVSNRGAAISRYLRGQHGREKIE